MKPVFLTTDISDFKQQDGRKKRKTRVKRLCVTNVTRLLLAGFVVIFTYLFFCLFLFLNKKKISLKDGDVWWKGFSNRIIVTLVSQGLRLLSFPVLLRLFTTIN